VFLLRSDGTIYGRFGTRSDHREWTDDVSVEGLRRALEGALEMHAAWPRDREALAGKRGPPPTFATPEQYPDLKGRYAATVDFAENPVASCIHCHQIGEAERALRRAEGPAIPDTVLFPHPHPRAVGLVLDREQRATVRKVTAGSAAEAAGFRPGDVVRTMAGQPLLSIADVQWVLHGIPAEGGVVEAGVRRGGEDATLTLRLAPGWRRADDLSWRASTWQLRRIALGGLKLDALSRTDRTRARLPREAIGLRVAHVGQHAPHDAAKRAGFRKGDVLVSFGGRTDLERETDLIRHALNEVAPGTSVAVRVKRDGDDVDLTLVVPR
jgi:S1-C subfamily serine protease